MVQQSARDCGQDNDNETSAQQIHGNDQFVAPDSQRSIEFGEFRRAVLDSLGKPKYMNPSGSQNYIANDAMQYESLRTNDRMGQWMNDESELHTQDTHHNCNYPFLWDKKTFMGW